VPHDYLSFKHRIGNTGGNSVKQASPKPTKADHASESEDVQRKREEFILKQSAGSAKLG